MEHDHGGQCDSCRIPLTSRTSAAIYADLIARLFEQGRLEDYQVTLHGKGVIPREMKRKFGASIITFKASATLSLNKVDLKKIIALALCSSAGNKCLVHNCSVWFGQQGVMVEATGWLRECENSDRGAWEQLRHYYREEMQSLVDLRHDLPAVSENAESISSKRSELVDFCTARAARIAQDEIEKHTGILSHSFTLLLCAGAVRGLSLFSDVDYALFRGGSQSDPAREDYFDLLAQRIEAILRYAGIKADNLIGRFTARRYFHLSVLDVEKGPHRIAGWTEIMRVLLDMKRVETVGSEDVFQLLQEYLGDKLRKRNNLKPAVWWKFCVIQSATIKEFDRNAQLEPRIWLREITISYYLAKYYLLSRCYEDGRLRQTHAFDFYQTFRELNAEDLITNAEQHDLFQAYDFFMTLRNEAGVFAHSFERTLSQTEWDQVASNLGKTLADLSRNYRSNSRTVSIISNRIHRKVGHGSLVLGSISLISSGHGSIWKRIGQVTDWYAGHASVSVVPSVEQEM
jgi:hypothetical protein